MKVNLMSDSPTKDIRRTELLNAAAELLALHPTASLSEIAAHAGIGKATLHRYFPGRDELMLALGYRALEEVSAAIQTAALSSGTTHEALARLIAALVPLGDKLYFLLYEPVLDTHPDFIAADQATQQPILHLIQRGQAAGELRTDLTADWILHQMNYALFATWQIVHQGAVARRDAPRLLTTTLLHGITGR